MAVVVRLSELVQQIIDEGEVLGPDAIARELLARRREFNLEAELQLLLRVYVLRRLSQQPTSRPVRPMVSILDPDDIELQPISAFAGGGVALAERPLSTKVHEYQRFPWLKRQMFVGDRTWKPLGDCSADEVEYLRDRRRTLARDLVSSAAFFDSLAQHMREIHAERVADLDDELLLRISEPLKRKN